MIMKQWKLTLRTSTILLVLILTLCFTNTAFADDTVHVFVEPNTANVTTCGTQTVEVRVEGATNLTGYHLEIGFDPSVIKVTNVVNGGFLVPPGESALYEPTNDIDNVTGLISFGLVQQGDGSGDPIPKTCGPGDTCVLLEITFQGVVPNGTSPITIDADESTLVDWPGVDALEFTTANGSVDTESCEPEDIALTGSWIPENEPIGTGIGSFFTIDPDVPYDSFIYTLVSGAGEDDNDSFEIVGSSLKSNEIFNYEDQWIYRIRVRSTDWGGKTVEKAFLIFDQDMNDPPIANNQSVFATQETPIDITLTGSDEDGDALTYEIVSGPTDGVLSGTAPNLTYTPGDDFFGDDSFTFRVFDGEDYSEPATVTIFVDEKKGTDYYFPIFVN
jgi:hypothetical protein